MALQDKTTYGTKRFNIVGTPNGRNGSITSKDQRFVNLFPELVKDSTATEKRYFLRERPGMIHKLDVGVTGTGRGIVYFNGYTFTAIGNKLYRDTTEIATLGNSSGKVGFTQFNGTYTALIALDGVKGFVIKTDNTVTEITDVDFPTPHLPYPIFLDGYLFVAKSGTDDIYNCDLEDPLTWTAGNFITAEMYPDQIKGLAKHKNYLVALGEQTTEQFYDAAIASGSPLQRNDSAVQQLGTPAGDSVVATDNDLIFVGTTNSGGRTIWVISGFESKEVGDPTVRQHLDSEGTNISQAVGYSVVSMGHKFYVLVTTTRTFVYDFNEKIWHEWSYSNDTTPFLCLYSCDHPDGSARMLHPTNGNVLALSETVAHDALTSTTSTVIYASATTEKEDFGNNKRKMCSKLSIIGDVPNDAASTPITVQWSDDDYKTWSTARTIQLQGGESFITQCGQFRRRAHRFIYNEDYPLRLEGYELDINMGV